MATLNPQILLAQQPIKPPNLDFSDTFVEMARIKAYQQAQRLEELKYGQLERGYARDEEFNRLASGLFTPPQAQPGAAPQQRGLAGGPPAAPGGAPPPGSAMAEPGQGPGPWAGGYGMPPGPGGAGGMPTSFTQAPAPAPMGGGQMPGMPPGIPAPTSMEPGTFTMAQGTPPPPAPRSLADGAPGGMPPAAPPPTEPAGLGTAQPGAPKSLLQPLNEDVLARMFANNPEKASKLMEGHLKMQEQKLKTSEAMNEQIYQTLSAVDRSPDPAKYWPLALKELRAKGVPIPASMSDTFDPALLKFQLRQHETLKTRLDEAKILHEDQKTATARANELHFGAQTRREEQGIGLDVGKSKREERETTSRVGLQGAQTAHALAQTAREKQAKGLDLNKDERAALNDEEWRAGQLQERKAKAGQVTEYTKDADWNVYLSQAMKEAGLPPGASPNDHPEVIGKARQYQVEDKQNVVRKTGMDAIQRQQGPAATKRLEASNAKGSSSEQVVNVLDEVDRLIDEGVYENVPGDATKMAAFWAGLRPDDAKAARTKRLYELGNQLTVGMAPNGSLGAGMSEGDRQTFERAGGDLQTNQAALSRKETIKSMRSLAKINLHDANKVWETHDKTGEFPRFGSAREERLKILTPERLEEAYQAKKAQGWTKPQVRDWWLQQGWKEE